MPTLLGVILLQIFSFFPQLDLFIAYLLTLSRSHPRPPPKNTIPTLHDKILRQIFLFLPRSTLFNVVQVSEHWNSIAIPIFWRNLCFKQHVLSRYTHNLEIHSQFVRVVQFKGMYFGSHNDVDSVINACNNITSIYFLEANITTNNIALLCERLSEKLKYLSFENCEWICGMQPLAQHITKLGKLKKLELKCIRRFDNTACGQIVAGCPTLEDLDFYDTDISDFSVHLVARHLPHIRSLSLASCKGVRDDSLIAIAESCSRLTSLDISYTRLTDRSLFALASARCRETITHLNLDGCNRITDAGLQKIVTQLPHQQNLVITSDPTLVGDLFNDPIPDGLVGVYPDSFGSDNGVPVSRYMENI
jgi:F-box-like/Leucine Rich repeat